MESSDRDAAYVADLTKIQQDLRDYATYLLGRRTGTQDIVQEINIVLWKKRSRFEMGTNFRAWAFTVARLVTMKYRKRMMVREKQLVFSNELTERLADEWHDDEKWRVENRIRALEECLDRVPEGDLDLLKARYSGYGNVERVASESGVSSGALRLRLFRLRAALKQCILNQLESHGAGL